MKFDPDHRRAVVTGLGVIAANGCTLDSFWESTRLGLSAARPVTRFDTTKLPCKIAAEIRDFDFGKHCDGRKGHRFDLSIQYGIAAARLATRDAQINISSMDPDRVGVVEASSVSGMESSFKGQTAFLTRGYRSMSPYTLINAYSGGGSGEIALDLGVHGHA